MSWVSRGKCRHQPGHPDCRSDLASSGVRRDENGGCVLFSASRFCSFFKPPIHVSWQRTHTQNRCLGDSSWSWILLPIGAVENRGHPRRRRGGGERREVSRCREALPSLELLFHESVSLFGTWCCGCQQTTARCGCQRVVFAKQRGDGGAGKPVNVLDSLTRSALWEGGQASNKVLPRDPGQPVCADPSRVASACSSHLGTPDG
jgi:hypothetical protein